MAGAGFKTFNTGDVLTAADVNTYLMQQTVLVFADAAARTTALSGVLAEGMISYLKDTNATEVYNGSAWVGITGDGDITGVTAGTGLTGGGTTGAVTLTNDMATTITAAGDIVVGTGSGTYDNLPIGTTGQILTADTTVSPYKVKWASPTAAGFVGCRAYLSTGFQVTLNTATAINWDSESFDTDGFHSTSTNTSRFTVPAGKAGKYKISYRGLITLDDGKQYIAEIYKNGSAITNERRNSGLNSFSTSKVDDVRNLAENDYIQIYLYQTQATQNVEPGEGTSYIIFEYLGA